MREEGSATAAKLFVVSELALNSFSCNFFNSERIVTFGKRRKFKDYLVCCYLDIVRMGEVIIKFYS